MSGKGKVKMKNKIKQINGLEWILIILFSVQLLISLYFNVALLGNHMDYDSSWSYLKAALMWKEKALVSSAWADQTSVFLDSSMLLASLLYGITGNLLVSYGISNMLILCGILCCMYSITKDFGLDRKVGLLCINLVICPYLVNGFSIVNDLGYFNNVISGPAFYSLRVLLFLMIVKSFLKLRRGGRADFYVISSLILCVLAGVSSGIFMIVIILLPCLMYILEKVLIHNSLKELWRPEALYTYLCIVIVYGSKMFAERALHIAAIDTSRSWTSIEKIWTNIGAVIQGWMKLLGVLPVTDTSIFVLSKEGLYRVFPLMLFFVLVVAVVFCIRYCMRNLKTADENVLFCCNIFVVNLLVFSLFNAQYGMVIFEERYLTCPYMAVILLLGYFLSRLNKELLLSKGIWGLLVIGILGNNIVSDYKYITTTNEYWEMEQIVGVIEEEDAELVYLWGNALYPIGRALRVYDLSHVYKCIADEGGFHHWGDYLYYDKNEDYVGATILIVPQEHNPVPETIMEEYVLLKELTHVKVYRADENVIGF